MIPKDAYPVPDAGDGRIRQRRSGGLPRQGARGRGLGGFAEAQGGVGARGKFRGIGLCDLRRGVRPRAVAHREPLGARGGLFESATVRVHPTGDVTVLIGTHNHGQGHETTFAQIVSEKLGIPTDNVEIVFGDTDKVQFGLGTYGSRSLAVGGTALAKATDKVIAKGKKIAAHMLEASEQRHRVRGRRVRRRRHRPHRRRFGEIARRGLRPGQLSARDPRARPGGAGLLRSGELHLSRRRAHRRGRDRSGDRHRSSCCPMSRSTTSAPSSTR